jgi:hypothetical protein
MSHPGSLESLVLLNKGDVRRAASSGEAHHRISIDAPANTDLFCDPTKSEPADSACCAFYRLVVVRPVQTMH